MKEPTTDGDSPEIEPLPSRAWSLLDLGLAKDEEEEAPEAKDLASGQKIGPYTLVRKMGEGGFGIVWLAEQNDLIQRTVALKLIKPGMDSRQVIARFEAERRTLSLMDHPNIATVLDAGTTAEGRPYFVMELVRGQPITAFCDEHRLSIQKRLEIFIHVCHGVQHAHQKAILHRDLKPSNILVEEVDGEPAPKIIDFGIAKALGAGAERGDAENSPFTNTGVVVGTPEYMSPEQASNDADVDACSDIYSLGAILYELATGRPPFTLDTQARAPMLQMLRKIHESEPTRPSVVAVHRNTTRQTAEKRGAEPRGLAQELRRDIDWIILKALEKDRRRRYESAAALAADLQRCLADEPVLARPPTKLYLLQKLVRRNKASFMAAALVTIAVIAGATAAGWNYLEMRRQKNIATEESTTSRDVAAFLANTVQDISPPNRVESGAQESTVNAAELRALFDRENQRRLRDLQSDPKTDMRVAKILAEAYAGLDELDEAAGLYETAHDRLKQLHLSETTDAADCLFAMAWCDHRQIEESGYSSHGFNDEELLRKALALWVKTLDREDNRILQGKALLAGVLRMEGKPADAAVILDHLVTGPEGERVKAAASYGWILREAALVQQDAGKFTEAEATLNEARLILKNTASTSNEQQQAEADICRLERLLYLQSGDLDAAENLVNKELELRHAWLGYWDPNVLTARAEISARKQEYRAAEGDLRESVEISQGFHWLHPEEEALRKLVEIDANLRRPSDPGRLRDITKLARSLLADADRERLSGRDARAKLAEAEQLLQPDESLHAPYPREAAAFFAARASEGARREDFGLAISELGTAALADPDDSLYPFETAVYALAGRNEQTFEVEREHLSRRLAPDDTLRDILWICRAATVPTDLSGERSGFQEAAATLPAATSAGHELDWLDAMPSFENLCWICRSILLHGRPSESELRRIRMGLNNADRNPEGFGNDLIALLMGMAEYRGRNYEDAVSWLDTAQKSHDSVIAVQAEIVAAMNSHELHLDESREELKRAESSFNERLAPFRDTDSTVALHDYWTTKFLMDEARALFSEAGSGSK